MNPWPNPESPDELRAFARQVLAILRDLYPGQRPTLGADGETVRLGSAQFGLDNLAAKFRQTGRAPDTLRRLVKEHFAQLLRDSDALLGDITWGEVKPILRPQLMPESLLRQLALAQRPFGPGVRCGLVVDAPSGYRYVRNEELEQWRVEAKQAWTVALANLAAHSQGLQVQGTPEPNATLALASGDGYDAVRVLLPRWRKLAAQHLGMPFRFGIPSRDCLICWSARNPLEVQNAFRARLAEDFRRLPYPLSPLAFEMNEEGNVRPLP